MSIRLHKDWLARTCEATWPMMEVGRYYYYPYKLFAISYSELIYRVPPKDRAAFPEDWFVTVSRVNELSPRLNKKRLFLSRKGFETNFASVQLSYKNYVDSIKLAFGSDRSFLYWDDARDQISKHYELVKMRTRQACERLQARLDNLEQRLDFL